MKPINLFSNLFALLLLFNSIARANDPDGYPSSVYVINGGNHPNQMKLMTWDESNQEYRTDDWVAELFPFLDEQGNISSWGALSNYGSQWAWVTWNGTGTAITVGAWSNPTGPLTNFVSDGAASLSTSGIWLSNPAAPYSLSIVIDPTTPQILIDGQRVVTMNEQGSANFTTFALGTGSNSVNSSLAVGESAKALGVGSTAFGVGTSTYEDHSFVAGKYNNFANVGLFIVGSGSDDSHRKNAMRVQDDGAVLIQPHGDIGMGAFTAGPQP